MLDKVKEMLAEQLGLEASAIGEDQLLKDDLGADSLDLFEMVTNLEDMYEIEIPTEELEKMLTVQDVANYLSARGIEE